MRKVLITQCLDNTVEPWLNLFTTVILGTEESGHCREETVMGKQECNRTPVFFRERNIFFLNEMLIAVCEYVTQSKYTDKTETKRK